MRLLLDESVPARLFVALPNHFVSTVVREGWSGVKNGKLLALAASSFDAFITVDKNLAFQQNLNLLPIAVVVLDAYSNELHALLPLMPTLEEELGRLTPRACVVVRSKGYQKARPDPDHRVSKWHGNAAVMPSCARARRAASCPCTPNEGWHAGRLAAPGRSAG